MKVQELLLLEANNPPPPEHKEEFNSLIKKMRVIAAKYQLTATINYDGLTKNKKFAGVNFSISLKPKGSSQKPDKYDESGYSIWKDANKIIMMPFGRIL
jgi:hypothetical protein